MTPFARRLCGTASLGAILVAGIAAAQDRGITFNLYGAPGLIEMPIATMPSDGQIATSFSAFDGNNRTAFTFQITPNLSGSFRYSGIEAYARDGKDYYDRSFDLRYGLTQEGNLMPAITIGLQDFLGTGLFSSEYVVASKTFGDSLRVSAGLGWGRLGSYNGFTNPLGLLSPNMETRPVGFEDGDTGGTLTNNYFRGDAAFFGGVEWAPNDDWLVKAEYSSDDAYVDARGNALLDRKTPLNFGLTWRPSDSYQVGLSYLYGSELAFTGTITFNPNVRAYGLGLDDAPVPVAVRAANVAAAQSWDRAALPDAALRAQITEALAADGFEVSGIALTDTTARVRYTNTDYRAEAQGVGRAARILTTVLPPSIEMITLEPSQAGMALSAVHLRRSDLEALENQVGGTQGIYERAQITDAGPRADLVSVADPSEAFLWSIGPYATFTLFDSNNPISVDLGLEAKAQYRIAPNLILSGTMRQSLLPDDGEAALRYSASHPVRRFTSVYNDEANPGILNLQLSYYERPAEDIYTRVSFGYLERMFGGVSTEVLYKPVATRWGIGAELNYVAQRDADMLLGFGDYCRIREGRDICEDPSDGDDIRDVAADYRTLSGHLSFYYDFDNGFHTQVDLGRYLAGDWGATLRIDREFENGWRVGAYATLTDMPFEDFGEGSFDKGIQITMPFDYLLGTPTRRQQTTAVSSLTRDGGARLNVEGRLYDIVRQGHDPVLEQSWGRFWR